VINLVCVVAIIAIVRRYLGVTVSALTALVLAVDVEVLDTAVLTDYWNPFISILPFAVAVLLLWRVAAGEWWPVVPAVLVASFVVQAHLSYAAPLAAAAAVSVVGAVMARRRQPAAVGSSNDPPRRWPPRAAAVAVAVALAWVLPAAQELHDPAHGNLTDILRYVVHSHATWPWKTAATVVSTESIRVFGAEVGIRPHSGFLIPDVYGTWVVALVAAGLALLAVAAIRRRATRPELVPLVVITLVVYVAAITVTRQIDGPVFFYLTEWMVVVGLIATILGLGVIADWPWPRVGQVPRLAVTVVWAAAMALVLVKVGQRPALDMTDPDAVAHMAPLIRSWLGPTRSASLDVMLDPASLTGTSEVMAGIALDLDAHGVVVHVPPAQKLAYAGVTTLGGRADRHIVIATVATPPQPGQQVIAAFARYRVYGSGGP
jgi:hypothetical protein